MRTSSIFSLPGRPVWSSNVTRTLSSVARREPLRDASSEIMSEVVPSSRSRCSISLTSGRRLSLPAGAFVSASPAGESGELDVPEQFPQPDGFGNNAEAALLLIPLIELLALNEPADIFVAEPAPGPHAGPGDILHWVSEMHHLPVEDSSYLAVAVAEEVPGAIISVDENDSLSRWRRMPAHPAESGP